MFAPGRLDRAMSETGIPNNKDSNSVILWPRRKESLSNLDPES